MGKKDIYTWGDRPYPSKMKMIIYTLVSYEIENFICLSHGKKSQIHRFMRNKYYENC
jgi:hypothetical protein